MGTTIASGASVLDVRVDGHIAHLEVRRPAARNALNKEVVEALTGALAALSRDDRVRALVLSGEGGQAFASGADIGELAARTHVEAFHGVNATLFQRLEDFPRPTIAAIEGYALGGGFELALACDLRVGSTSAKVGLPEVTLGIFPAAGGTSRLPRLVGLGRAKELIFTGRILDAEEAHRLGIFEVLCRPGDALAQARALASKIAQAAPLAVQVAKVALNAASKGGPAFPLEQLGQALLFDSPEKAERMAAFLARKKG